MFGRVFVGAKKLADLYADMVTTRVQFDGLRQYTKESIDEFKRLLERQSDKIDRIERERIKAEAELQARIQGLEARLNVLSEKALHAAVADMAAEYARRGGGDGPTEAPAPRPLPGGRQG
ncbi:hypothetical protein [Methylosinus sp. RM1]|uniref:hypothetical protein n=1 Tax=Methylosinus sp. RM1 TaxID=2583817 RepID=UPI00140AA2EA|nr:hypothetical protein [Methylosinus sp. RM1]